MTKRNINEFTNLIGFDSAEEMKKLSEEFDNEITLRPFKVNDDRKNAFSEKILQISDPEVFMGFKPTIDLIASIILR